MQRFAFISDADEDRVMVLRLFLKSLGYQVVAGDPDYGVTSYLLDTWKRHVVLLGPGTETSFLRDAVQIPDLQRHTYIVMTALERTIRSRAMNLGERLHLFVTPFPLDLSHLKRTITAIEQD